MQILLLPSPYSFCSRSQKIWRSEKKSVSGCRPSFDTFWNRWRWWSAGRTDSSSRRKTPLRIAWGRSWPRTKIRPLYFSFFYPPFFFLFSFSVNNLSRKSVSLPSPDHSKSSRQGERSYGIDDSTERIDRGDGGQDAKHGYRTIWIGGEGSKDGGPVDRLRAGQGTFSKGQANGI